MFVVVLPVTFAIGQSFSKRELAIDSINEIRSLLYKFTATLSRIEWADHGSEVCDINQIKDYKEKHKYVDNWITTIYAIMDALTE